MNPLRPAFLDFFEKERQLKATLELSAALSGAGAEFLQAAGILSELYIRELSPDPYLIRRVRDAVERARKALDEYDAQGDGR